MNHPSRPKGRAFVGARIFAVLGWVFAACVLIQTLIAGMAIFNDGTMWRQHVQFVHLFEFVPLLMLLTGFALKMPAEHRWKALALFLLVIAQYATANVPAAGALHPVIAAGLIWLSVKTALSAGKGDVKGEERGA